MKKKLSNYCEIYNRGIEILNQNKIPYSTKWLYIHLCLLEHRFTGAKVDFFFRSIEDLRKDTNISRRLLIGGIKKLNALKLIYSWQMHWEDKKTKKKSEKHISAFRILEP